MDVMDVAHIFRWPPPAEYEHHVLNGQPPLRYMEPEATPIVYMMFKVSRKPAVQHV